MKAFRIFLIGAAVLAGLLVVVFLLALLPSVQTWAARRALAQQPNMRGDIGRVSVGFNQVQVAAFRIERPGMILTVPSATVDVPVAPAASKQVLIHRLVAKGWVLDLTAPATLGVKVVNQSPQIRLLSQLAVIGLAQVQPVAAAPAEGNAAAAPAVAVTQPFLGVFKLLNLPVDLQVDEADLEGDVLFLTKPGQPPGRAHVTITGGQLGVGRTGQFKITSVAKLSGSNAPVTDVNSQTLLQAKMDTPRTFESLTGKVDITATGPKFPQGAKLKGDLNAQRGGKTEDYSFTLRSVDASGDKQVLDVHGSYPVDSRQLTGTWKLDARDVDLAPLALGIPLPSFVAVGEGRFETDSTFQEVHAIGSVETTLDKLEALTPSLSVVGRIRVKADFDLIQRELTIRIGRFSADVQGSKPIASMQALQSIEVNPSTGELKVADPTKDLFRFKIEGLPLAWAQPFVPGYTIRGEDLRGEVLASARNGGVTVHSAAPVIINGLTVSSATTPMIQAVDVSTVFTADYSPNGWQADVSDLSLRSAGAAWAQLSLKAGQPAGKDQPIKATGQYQVDLPAALRQPALAQLGSLTKGRVQGDFSAVITTPLQQIAAKLEVRDLVSPAVSQPLPVLLLTLRADLQADGLIKVQAPLIVQQGERKSDLNLTAELRPAGAKQSIDAQVESNLLYVEDVQILAAPLQTRDASASPPPPKPSPAPAPRPTPNKPGTGASPGSTPATTGPFWSGVTGQLRLALKKVIYSPDVQAADVSGSLKIKDDAITLENLRAVMGEGSSAKVSGDLTFNAKAQDPYALAGELNVANLNPGPILALLSPQHQPTVEGHFDLVGKFNGEAARPEALGDKTSAEIKLTSRGGKFNGFAAGARAADLGKVQKTASTAATILGFASGLMGENKVAAYAEQFRAAADILKRFVQIDFDQLNLEISHRPGEETKIKDFSLISPSLRFIGTGGIEGAGGKPWLDQPLSVVLDMSVRGEQANDMKVLGLLQDTPDSLGYVPLRDKVTINGTLSNLGTDYFTKLLGKLQLMK